MVAEFKNLAELQDYCNAQFKTIIELTKKLNGLKEQNDSLALTTNNISGLIQFPSLGLAPEEEICLKQLHDLNISSKTRELTLEEAKKCEIFTKIVTSIRLKTKDVDGQSKHLSNDELLALVGSGIT